MNAATIKAMWTGKSDQRYEYSIYKIGTGFNPEPGNYIFCKRNGGTWEPQYIGQSENLSERLESHEQENCARRNGATHIHAHVTPDKDARLAEEKDLIENYQPTCNTQHAG